MHVDLRWVIELYSWAYGVLACKPSFYIFIVQYTRRAFLEAFLFIWWLWKLILSKYARRLQDLAGYGVAIAVGKIFATAFPDRTFRSPLVELLIKNGRNGKNNGRGYYIYEKGSKPKPDPSVLPIIEESRKLANIMPEGKVMLFHEDIIMIYYEIKLTLIPWVEVL